MLKSDRDGAGRLGTTTFYGRSFIAGPQGEIRQRADDWIEGLLVETLDLDAIAEMRANCGVFRDRRPYAYVPPLTLDGTAPGLMAGGGGCAEPLRPALGADLPLRTHLETPTRPAG